MASQKIISIVIPVFNEAEGISIFHDSVLNSIKKLNYKFEIIYINDGSTDKSLEILHKIAETDRSVKVINFSRNFGKEMATTAGMHESSGDAVIIIDADGQHPVELIPDFISKWESGVDVVIGVRESNQKEGFIKKGGSILFYSLLKQLGVKDVTPGSTDFRIIDKVVVDEFKTLTEHNRITRALIDWLGYDRDIIYFSAKAREYGSASYSVKKLTGLAFNGFVSLSFTPLYLAGYVGAFITTLSLIASVFIVIEKYILGDPLGLNVSGTALLALLLIFLVGIILVFQGLISIYLARIYTETQNRPLYIVRKSPK